MTLTISQLETRKKMVLRCLAETLGDIHSACALAQVSVSTFYAMCGDVDFREEVEQIKGEAIGWGISKLKEHIEAGSEKSLHFFLRFKGGFRDVEKSNNQKSVINQELYTKLKGLDKQKLSDIAQIVDGSAIRIESKKEDVVK
jgi:hypothetical protein